VSIAAGCGSAVGRAISATTGSAGHRGSSARTAKTRDWLLPLPLPPPPPPPLAPLRGLRGRKSLTTSGFRGRLAPAFLISMTLTHRYCLACDGERDLHSPIPMDLPAVQRARCVRVSSSPSGRRPFHSATTSWLRSRRNQEGGRAPAHHATSPADYLLNRLANEMEPRPCRPSAARRYATAPYRLDSRGRRACLLAEYLDLGQPSTGAEPCQTPPGVPARIGLSRLSRAGLGEPGGVTHRGLCPRDPRRLFPHPDAGTLRVATGKRHPVWVAGRSPALPALVGSPLAGHRLVKPFNRR